MDDHIGRHQSIHMLCHAQLPIHRAGKIILYSDELLKWKKICILYVIFVKINRALCDWRLYISVAGRMNAIVVVVIGVWSVRKQIQYWY